MTKSSTAISGKATYEAMIARSDRDLAALRKEEQEANRDLQKARQEQQVLATRAIARSGQMQTAQNEVLRLQEAIPEHQASVEIAQGTSAHADLVDAMQKAEKQLRQAEQELQKVEASTGKGEQADSTRRAAVEATIERETIHLAQIAEKRAAITAARERAINDLGQAEYHEVMSLVEVLQRHVASKQQQLDQAQQELEEKLQQGIDRLIDWPELESQVKTLLVHRDPATDLLETFISLLNILIEKGPDAAIDSFVVQGALDRRFMTLEMLLSVAETYILDGLRGRDVQVLEERREQVEKILTAYRDARR